MPPLLAILLPFLASCVLDRSGELGCPQDGAISCNVFDVSYSFTPGEHNYVFKGSCTLIEEKGQSELNDPEVDFQVAGEYRPDSLSFRESVLVEHDTFPLTEKTSTEWALEGFSPLDPWLYTSIPVGIQQVVGDPNEFARGLCIAQVPNEYRRVPFSRNVIVHMLSLQQIISMRLEAANPEDKPEAQAPPPPPCPPSYLTSAPEMRMPKQNLVYKEDVEGVTVELRSQCGADNVDYQRSRYGLRFDHYESGSGWTEYRTFEIPMKSYTDGGSQGFDTLPMKGAGQYRVKALQHVTLKGASSGQYGSWSDWVHFRIGPASLDFQQLENLADLVQFVHRDNAFRAPPPPDQRKYRSAPLRSVTGSGIRSGGSRVDPE